MAIKNLGRVQGLSAYEIWLQQGNTGTEEDFIKSLIGESGKGIVNIEKTSTDNLIDIYTITYTDNTTDTFQVKNGKDGANGQDGVNGQDGQDGRGIVNIEKTSTSGLIDTYTITYTDGTTSTYNVTNGKDAQSGGGSSGSIENKLLSQKFIHMSLDDVGSTISSINNSSTASIYDIPLLAFFKEMHDTYGMVFSLYLQNSTFNFDTTTTNGLAKKNELFEARDWLKFGLHNGTGANNTNYASETYGTYDTGKAHWESFVSNIIRHTGSTDSIDRIPRLENFAVTEECAKGMRDAYTGVMGFLGADDTRDNNTYMTSEERQWLNGWDTKTSASNWQPNDYWTDYSNGLRVFKTDLRLEYLNSGTTNPTDLPNITKTGTSQDLYDGLVAWYKDAKHGNIFCPLIVFTHETLIVSDSTKDSYKGYVEKLGQFAQDYGLSFDFPQNRFVEMPHKCDRYPSSSSVIANPELTGTEDLLQGIQIDDVKYSVSGSSVAVEGITLPETMTIAKDGTYTIRATISPSNATNKSINWSVLSGDDLISISGSATTATITGLNAGTGTAVVRATTVDGEFTADCTITVLESIVNVTSISLDKTSVELTDTNKSDTITATILPSDATVQSVTYSVVEGSSNVSISQNGLSCTISKVVAKGNATIRCSANDESGIYVDCTVTCTSSAEVFIVGSSTVRSNADISTVLSSYVPQCKAGVTINNTTRAIIGYGTTKGGTDAGSIGRSAPSPSNLYVWNVSSFSKIIVTDPTLVDTTLTGCEVSFYGFTRSEDGSCIATTSMSQWRLTGWVSGEITIPDDVDYVVLMLKLNGGSSNITEDDITEAVKLISAE